MSDPKAPARNPVIASTGPGARRSRRSVKRTMNDAATIGVIFDVDGVLVDSYAAHLDSWRRLALELHRSIAEQQFAATFGRTSRDIIAELFHVQDDARIRQLDDRKEAFYRDRIRGCVPAMPGAVSLVTACHQTRFRIAVGSSGPARNVRLVCDEMRLTPMLSAIVTGDDVTRGKPDPQVFRLAADRMKLPSSRCLVIEDAPAGIEAARRATMPAIALTSTHTPDTLRSAKLTIDGLDQITPATIAKLVGDFSSMGACSPE